MVERRFSALDVKLEQKFSLLFQKTDAHAVMLARLGGIGDCDDDIRPHTRKTDTTGGVLKQYWRMFVLVALLSALAGEKVIPFVLRILGLG